MDLSQYEASKKAYYDANPYGGDVSHYYGADALAGGWGNEADMAVSTGPAVSAQKWEPLLAQWQKAYPYIMNKSTGIKLGDYEDAKRKFMDAWSKSNPWTGPNMGMSFSPMQWEQGWTPTQADYANKQAYDDYEAKMEAAWASMLTPAQINEFHSQKSAKYDRQNKLAKAAFLAAAGGMAFAGAGGFGAMMGEGAGAGATGGAGLGGLDAADIAGGLIPEYGTSAAYSSIPGLEGMAGGTLANSAGSLWNSIPDYLKSLGGNAIKNMGGNFLSQLISSGVNAYMGNKQAGNYQNVIDEINSLYSPDSAYAKQMKQALARKDAAAGRNSQYGSREVELAAALTQGKANALTSPGYGNLLSQRGINQNVPWNGFLAALGSGAGQDLITKAGSGLGGWLSGMYGNSGNKYSPTAPNTSGSSNWWNQLYADGGP